MRDATSRGWGASLSRFVFDICYPIDIFNGLIFGFCEIKKKLAFFSTIVIFCYYQVHNHNLLGGGNSSKQFGKEGNVLFNDALNVFYLRLYGVRHMVKYTQIVREETRCCHMGYSFLFNNKGSFMCTIPHTGNTYHGLWYTSRGALAGTRNSKHFGCHMFGQGRYFPQIRPCLNQVGLLAF